MQKDNGLCETKMRKILQRLKYLIDDGFFHILIGNILTKLIAFISSIVIVRLVSKTDYGFLSYADNLYSYIMLFSGLGLSTAILKFCSPKRSMGENKYFLNIAMRYGVAFQFACSLLLILIVYITDIPFPDAKPLIYTLVLYPTLTQVVTTLQSFVRSQLENKLYAKIGLMQAFILFASSFVLAYLLGVVGVAFARYIAMTVAIIITARFINNMLKGTTEPCVVEKEELKDFWSISISLMLANLFSMIMPINEQFLINSMIRDEIITANYKVAILIPSQILFITNSVVIYVFPKISMLSKKRKEALRYSIYIESILAGLIMIVCILGYYLTPLLVNIIYGDRYNDSIELSQIYWIVYGLNAGFRMLPMNILPAIGSTFFNSISSIISCAIHALLLVYMIPKYGIFGAAYALIIIYIVSGILYWLYLFVKCSKARN